MKQPPTPAEKLGILFRNKIRRRGHIANVHFDQVITPSLASIVEPNETFIVRIASTKAKSYWFSDRRIIEEGHRGASEFARYEAIQTAHWMFSDLLERLRSAGSNDEISTIKANHFDRIEIELPTGNVCLEGLHHAYSTILTFCTWLVESKRGSLAGHD